MKIFLILSLLHFTCGHEHRRGPHSDDDAHVGPFDVSDSVPGEPFTPIDYHLASLLSVAPPNRMHDPIELAGLYEGDIVLTEEDVQNHFNTSGPERNAIKREDLKWPGGVIPYTIASNFNPQERLVIASAFLEYHQKTCITFRPRTTEPNYINIHKGSGCSSRVGRVLGEQKVSLGAGCVYPGIAIHELMHAVGFWHEQSRGDRDDHITIHYNNVQQGMSFNFQKFSWDVIQHLDVTYDVSSIMHYGPYAFAIDRSKPTITPKVPNSKMGQRERLTDKDILKINRLYNCPAGATTEAPLPTTQGMDNSGSKPDCVDNHKYCKIWAQRGECKKNPAWMKVNCKASCKTCDIACDDVNKYCPSWSIKGECTRNPAYMQQYCAKSCNRCKPAKAEDATSTTTASTDAPINLSKCEDSDETCPALAVEGKCADDPQYMAVTCPKSCSICEATTDY